uniref:Uncharacterized protein n=1 Tax=Physcomitrium patens TaxID=3218 RepID=A0A2K1IUU6_PHYPA|nr:hypothetical protein PHYPA_024989 [Physcomitrium patens]
MILAAHRIDSQEFSWGSTSAKGEGRASRRHPSLPAFPSSVQTPRAAKSFERSLLSSLLFGLF